MKNNLLTIQYVNREKRLNAKGITYPEFLKSKDWIELKNKLKQLPEYQCCYICGNTRDLNFHHVTYRRLFKGNFNLKKEDIFPLCILCHNYVHEYYKNNLVGLRGGLKACKKNGRPIYNRRIKCRL